MKKQLVKFLLNEIIENLEEFDLRDIWAGLKLFGIDSIASMHKQVELGKSLNLTEDDFVCVDIMTQIISNCLKEIDELEI